MTDSLTAMSDSPDKISFIGEEPPMLETLVEDDPLAGEDLDCDCGVCVMDEAAARN
ncbi:hypothetical protein GCM10009626_41140 [Brachybacterium sacelli]